MVVYCICTCVSGDDQIITGDLYYHRRAGARSLNALIFLIISKCVYNVQATGNIITTLNKKALSF